MSREDDIKKLITTHDRRLQKLREQQALHGISADPSIIIEIEDIETKIEDLRAELGEILESPQPPSQVRPVDILTDFEIPEEPPSLLYVPVRQISIPTLALADMPSDIDLLGFSVYADAMVDFIKNDKTEKPLTIGIDAPWGMGKTSLMYMIRDRLIKPKRKFWFLILLDKIKITLARLRGQTIRVEHSLPTVWFNAWKYDQEESLWAALVLEILNQVRKQSNVWQRMGLWIKLNTKRFDWGLFAQGVLKSLAYPFGIGLLGGIVFFLALLRLGATFTESTERLKDYIEIIGGLGAITMLFSAGREAYKRITGPFDLKIAQYVREPNYKERVGFLAQFEDDFKRVIEVVTNNGKQPLVVFIDDLDRCIPPKSVEIIEAINILIDAKHCVFVIGMDAQTVAGSIEAKYKDLKKYLEEATNGSGDYDWGRRFLEKMVQINFRIPRADPGKIGLFIEANLNSLNGELFTEPSEQEITVSDQLIKPSKHETLVSEQPTQSLESENNRSQSTDKPILTKQSGKRKGRKKLRARRYKTQTVVKSVRAKQHSRPTLGIPLRIRRYKIRTTAKFNRAKRRQALGKTMWTKGQRNQVLGKTIYATEITKAKELATSSEPEIGKIEPTISLSEPEQTQNERPAKLTGQKNIELGKPTKKPGLELAEIEELIKAEQAKGKSLDEAIKAVQIARPEIPVNQITEAARDLFAKTFDGSEEVRNAIREAAPYLEFNPRKIKRFINIFRLQAMIANRRKLLETGLIRLNMLAKWLIITIHWPDLVEAIMDQDFIERLKEAHKAQRILKTIQSKPVKGEQIQSNIKYLQSQLDTLSADPKIRQLMSTNLLDDISSSEVESLPYYLYLAQIAVEGAGQQSSYQFKKGS